MFINAKGDAVTVESLNADDKRAVNRYLIVLVWADYTH
jgi:hypothetical protein